MSKCPLVRKALSASLVYRHSAAHAPFGCEVTVGQFDRLATDIPNFFLHEPLVSANVHPEQGVGGAEIGGDINIGGGVRAEEISHDKPLIGQQGGVRVAFDGVTAGRIRVGGSGEGWGGEGGR